MSARASVWRTRALRWRAERDAARSSDVLRHLRTLQLEAANQALCSALSQLFSADPVSPEQLQRFERLARDQTRDAGYLIAIVERNVLGEALSAVRRAEGTRIGDSTPASSALYALWRERMVGAWQPFLATGGPKEPPLVPEIESPP
jgi:hypothetical protein